MNALKAKFQTTREANIYHDHLLGLLVMALGAALAIAVEGLGVPAVLAFIFLLAGVVFYAQRAAALMRYDRALRQLRRQTKSPLKGSAYATPAEDAALDLTPLKNRRPGAKLSVDSDRQVATLTRRGRDDEGASPVVGVILMVALTVALAAGVYLWVTGFTGSQQGPPASLGLQQNGAAKLDNETASAACTPGATWCAKWIVSSVTSAFPATRLRVTDTTTDIGTLTCTVNAQPMTQTPLKPGDVLACYTTTLPRAKVGDRIAFSDTEAGSVLTQLPLI